jgi:transposase
MSLVAVQKIVDRVSESLVPHYELIAALARQAPVGYIDETPWYCQNALNWLWTMATDTVTLYLIHLNRSKEAFFDLIEDWKGLVVSDGYGVYQDWVNRRQTCLAHLIAPPAGYRKNATRSLRPVGLGRFRSCSGCVIWPKHHRVAASGVRGMQGFAV